MGTAIIQSKCAWLCPSLDWSGVSGTSTPHLSVGTLLVNVSSKKSPMSRLLGWVVVLWVLCGITKQIFLTNLSVRDHYKMFTCVMTLGGHLLQS